MTATSRAQPATGEAEPARHRTARTGERALSVLDYFTESADYWDRVYAGAGIKAQVYRRRQSTVLRWATAVARPGSRALDLGAGAGHLSVALARSGLRVVAVDSSEAMLGHVARNAAAAGVADPVTSLAADARRLPFEADEFDLTAGLGLLPWVDDAGDALREMARVTRPGGHVLFTMDNSRGVARFLDPGWHPRARALIGRVRSSLGLRPHDPGEWPVGLTAAEVEALVRSSGLVRLRRAGVGFGPFTFLGRRLLPDALGVRLDLSLQRLSNRRLPALQRAAVFHVVLAEKPR